MALFLIIKSEGVRKMTIDIGSNIKELRLSKNMTQEQLAEKMGVSSQAISKWENGVSAPDIQLLPELSVFFGVTIDELFTLSDKERFERIDNMIYDVRFISESTFRDTVRFLEAKRAEESAKAKATLLLAMLYNKKAKEFHELASPLAREALYLDPENSEAHNAVFSAENGPFSDWNFTNHRKLIDFYKQFVSDFPNDIRNYLWLLDLLIFDGRTEEAREYAEKMNAVEQTYHYDMVMGEICRAEHNMEQAMVFFNKMITENADNWLANMRYADAMARSCRYEDAVKYYKAAMPLRPKPQFIDCEEALSHIYEITGDYDKAIEMNYAIIDLMKTQWNETEGEGIDFYLREIERLNKKKKV